MADLRPVLARIFKWTTVAALVGLGILAAAFWTMVLGRFSAGGFHAGKGVTAGEAIIVTPECAWPYDVHDHDAESVCRLFYNLSPEEREKVLKARGPRP